jgi:hypothetical protein
MPLLEIKQIRRVTAIVTLDEEIAKDIDIYAALADAKPDEVINNALAYVFGRDKDFQSFKQTETSKHVARTLRIKTPVSSTNGHGKAGK